VSNDDLTVELTIISLIKKSFDGQIQYITICTKRSRGFVINVMKALRLGLCSIQFNSKTLFKDGYPVNLQLIFPGAIDTYEQ